MINIIYEDNHLIVVEKKPNIPVQKDISNDEDLLSLIKSYIKKKYNKPNNVYLGLVHRLDRPVGGIMVFAKTSKGASRISEQIRNKTFRKSYYAVVCGSLKDSATLIDYLIKDKKNNIVKVNSNGKKASLDYKVLKVKNNLSFVDINLKTGRPHQIRVQFSSRNYPLYGDQKYNKNAKIGEQIALFAYKISFLHPITKERLEFKLNLPERYPFNMFKV